MRIRVAALILLLSALAFADPIDKLGHALLRDRSYKVRAQAAIILGKLKGPRSVELLIQALHDRDPGVRAVAASSLGKLRDPSALEALAGVMNDPSSLVCTAVGQAIGAIEGAPDEKLEVVEGEHLPAGPRRFSIELSPVAPNKGGAEMAKFVSGEVTSQIGYLNNITLQAEPNVPRYFLDVSITKLNSGAADTQGHVKVECELSVIIASHPDHAIKAMSTLWSSVEEQGGKSTGSAAAQEFCLGEASKMVAEKMDTYLKGVR